MYADLSRPASMMERITGLHEQRLDHVVQRLKATGARRVLDLGCGAGHLLQRLAREPQFDEIVGLERSGAALREARALLSAQLAEGQTRLRLVCGSYAEGHLAFSEYDAAAMVETIEHVRPEQLSTVERSVFGGMRPRFLYLTTPNREYNPLFGLAPGERRVPGHRFEWDRARFRRWAVGVAGRNGYRVTLGGLGEGHPELGFPTQTALFERLDPE